MLMNTEERAALPDEERLDLIRGQFWIGYPKAKLIQEQMEELLIYPKSQRMPNLAIIGETNSGKTLLLRRFCKKHNPPVDANAEKTQIPVLLIEVPTEPDESRLYGEILEVLLAPGSMREPVEARVRRIQHLLRAVETKIIILDEFQNALAGSPVKLRRFLNSIKYLGNTLQIPIVVAGTPETLNVLRADPQMSNRFPPAVISKWTYDESYLRLLASIETYLPLRNPSNLIEEKTARRILELSEGTIGEIVSLLRVLAKDAIKVGREKIDFDSLKVAYLKNLGWVIPSERSRYSR